jgi:hypothetical protein
MVWTIFCYRRPILAGAFLGVAVGTAFYLLVTVPAWVSFYRRRGELRFLVSFLLSAGLGLGVLGGLLWINGELPSSLRSGWFGFDWLPWKRLDPEPPGFWKNIPGQSAYKIPLFIAAMSLVVTSAFWPAPKNLAHVLALSAATLISIQFWYADRGGVYVLWFLPLLLLLLFRPNLSTRHPPIPHPDDWPARVGRWVKLRVYRILRQVTPAERVG